MDDSYDLNDDWWVINMELWDTYTFYTRKFYISIYDDTITDCATNGCSRSFGVLSDSWLGYSDLPRGLYILDVDGN